MHESKSASGSHTDERKPTSEICTDESLGGEIFFSALGEEITSACLEKIVDGDREIELAGSSARMIEPRLDRRDSTREESRLNREDSQMIREDSKLNSEDSSLKEEDFALRKEDSTALERHISGVPSTENGGGHTPKVEKPSLQLRSTASLPCELAGGIEDAGAGSILDVANGAPLKDRPGIRPRDTGVLAERLSDRLGMAVATVFYEVMEQSRDFGSRKSRVDDLSKLLAAAMKESLVRVLVGDERTVFLENFRNSFISTYKTIRSVRRAYKTTTVPPGSKSRRALPSQSHRDMETGHNADTQKRQSGGDRQMRKHNSWAKSNRERTSNGTTLVSNGQLQSTSEDEMISLHSSTIWQRNEQSDAESSSDKSCLDGSLQLSVFTSTNHEDDRHSDTGESCGKNTLDGHSESSFVSTNLEQSGYHGTSIRGMGSLPERVDSPLSQTPDARDVKADCTNSEYESQDDMVSAGSSSDSEGWVMVNRNDCVPAVLDQAQRMPSQETDVLKRYVKRNGEFNGSHGNEHLIGNVGGLLSNSWVARSAASRSDDQIDGNVFYKSLPSQGMPLGTKEDTSERAAQTPGPRSETPSTRIGFLGRTNIEEEGNDGILSIHRPTGQPWRDSPQRRCSALDDTIISGGPSFYDYGRSGDSHALYLRSVEAQETCNYLKSLELAQIMKRLSVKEDHLLLQEESNILMRENVGLIRSKAEFKEFELEDRKLNLAHEDLSRMCADELVAGLCVMIFALMWGAWKFSYTRLSEIVTACHLPVMDTRRSGWFGTNWIATGMDVFTWQLKALSCEFTKALRMLAGLALLAFVTSVLLRRGTASSQAMPATIIIVILGGICGFAGKISIDSLGGRGFQWIIIWESLCLLHILATCCTPWLHKYLYGPSLKLYGARSSRWLKFCSIFARILFHTLLIFGLPIMAGLLPFASSHELKIAFWELWGT